MVDTVLRAAKAREKRLSLIGAGTVFAVRLAMIDPAHVIVGVKGIPSAVFVGMNDGTEGNEGADHRDAFVFLPKHKRQCATLTLANDDHDAPLAGLFLG